MTVKEGFMLKKMGNQAVVVAVGTASKVFNGMIKLNESGEMMWNLLVDGATEDDLLEAVLEAYEVDPQVAIKDVEKFIETLKKPGIIE